LLFALPIRFVVGKQVAPNSIRLLTTPNFTPILTSVADVSTGKVIALEGIRCVSVVFTLRERGYFAWHLVLPKMVRCYRSQSIPSPVRAGACAEGLTVETWLLHGKRVYISST
jgi:hypothetical protein